MAEKIVVKYTKPIFHLYQASDTRKKEGKMSVDLKPRTEAGDSVTVTSQDIRRYTAC